MIDFFAEPRNKFSSTVTVLKLLQALGPSKPSEIWSPHWCVDVDFHLLGYDHVHRSSRPRLSTLEDETSGLSCSVISVASYPTNTALTSHMSEDFNYNMAQAWNVTCLMKFAIDNRYYYAVMWLVSWGPYAKLADRLHGSHDVHCHILQHCHRDLVFK